MASRDLEVEGRNKATVQAAFDDWAAGTGGPFTLLAADATWTIVGKSPVSGTYHSRQEFLDTVIDPLYARMTGPLVPTVRGLYAEGDTVIALFDARSAGKDGRPYENTYTWYMHMRDGAIIEVIAFFDTVTLTDFWNRVVP